jgi:hypothetical protein
VVCFTPRLPYPQGKRTRYPLDKRPGGPQNHSGRGSEEKNSQPPTGIEPQNPYRPAHSPAVYRLNYYLQFTILNVLVLTHLTLLNKPGLIRHIVWAERRRKQLNLLIFGFYCFWLLLLLSSSSSSSSFRGFHERVSMLDEM